MRLTRKQTICDIPILKIRDYFDHIRPALISPEMISEQFDLNKEKTKELIDALLSEGYIEAAKKKGKYQLTIKGQALCVARYTNPLNKEKADKLFKEFMERSKRSTVMSFTCIESPKSFYSAVILILKKQIIQTSTLRLNSPARPKVMRNSWKWMSKELRKQNSPENLSLPSSIKSDTRNVSYCSR